MRSSLTEDAALYDSARAIVLNAIYPKQGTVKTYAAIPLQQGYRVLLFSDGIGDNLTDEELARLVPPHHVSAQDAFSLLSDITSKRMAEKDEIEAKTGDRSKVKTYSDGFRSKPKEDNRALVIMDIA